MRILRTGLIGGLAVAALVVVSCGGDDGNGGGAVTSAPSPVESTVPTATTAPSQVESTVPSATTAPSQVESTVPSATRAPSQIEPPAPTVPLGWSGVPAPPGCGDYNDLALGPDSTIWAGGTGLNTFDGSQWRQLTEEDGLPVSNPAADGVTIAPSGDKPCRSGAPTVNDVVVAPDGTVWLTTVDDDAGGGFVVSYDGASFEQHSYPGDLAPESFLGYLRVDDNGSVWFPTFEGPDDEVWESFTGVARLRDDGGWDEFPLDSPIGPPPGFELAPDGVAWLVTSDSILELSDGSWVELDVADLVTLGDLGAPAVGPGGLWVGVQQGGTPVALAHRVDNAWVVETADLPDLFGQYVVDPTGRVWGTLWRLGEGDGFGGLASFDGEVWTLHPSENLSPFETPGPPYLLAADDSVLLIGTPAGFGDLLRFGTG